MWLQHFFSHFPNLKTNLTSDIKEAFKIQYYVLLLVKFKIFKKQTIPLLQYLNLCHLQWFKYGADCKLFWGGVGVGFESF